MPLFATILFALGSFAAVVWTLALVRLGAKLRQVEALRPGPVAWAEEPPPVHAVVPAHNEEGGVEATVRMILAQDYPRLTLTVVDDRSTDATGKILDRLAAEFPRRLGVIHGAERPDGWVGKTWAMHQATRSSLSPWLWFVDADMGLHPTALAQAMKLALGRPADLVTLAPRAVCETPWQAAAGLALTHLLAHLYPVTQVNDPDRKEAMAVGGFILVRREVYASAGGHEAVRSHIVEDIQLARRIKANGGRLALASGLDLCWHHLYGSLPEIWHGLKKNAYAGMEYQFHKFAAGAFFALVLAWGPALAILGGLALTLLRGPNPPNALLLAVGLYGQLVQWAHALPFARRLLRIPAWQAVLLPVGITLYVAISAASVRDHLRGRITWKGRVYDARQVEAGSRGLSTTAAAPPGPGHPGA